MPTERIIKFVPPLWLFLFLFLALLAHYQLPATRIFEFSSPVASTLCVIIGFALTLRASNIFAIEKTEILPNSPTNRVLVTRGPFRISRNPMYLGLIFLLLGVAFYFGTLPFFLATIAQFSILNFIFIPFEEEKMARQFGEAYAAYKHTVRRWI